jgi:hypothetical protein
VQIGNCGSSIELNNSWLLLTHSVGPVRKYAIGAVLLDKKDPSKVVARSRQPLVRPEPTEWHQRPENVLAGHLSWGGGTVRHGCSSTHRRGLCVGVFVGLHAD